MCSMTIVDLAFDLIKMALGNREKLSMVPSEKEWETHHMSVR